MSLQHRVTPKNLIDQGKVELTKQFSLLEHCALIEEMKTSGAFDKVLPMKSLKNLASYFKILPPEVAMKLWYSISASMVENCMNMHPLIRAEIIEILSTKEEPEEEVEEFPPTALDVPAADRDDPFIDSPSKFSAKVRACESLQRRKEPGMKRLLIVDGLNIYMRNYTANPSVSENGEPIGGCKGFLASLQKMARFTEPDKIVVVWDGEGGSVRKRKLVKGYKGGRKPVRLNRLVRDQLTEEQQMANRSWQYERTVDYLNSMPVHQIRIDGCEADDVISYINKMPQFEEWLKVIVSTDKDFYQCVEEANGVNKTIVYRPREKGKIELVRQKDLLNDYGVHPINFVLVRALEGDKSDNLPGVAGVGIKSAAKRFPFLAEGNEYMLQDIFEACEKNLGKIKMYDKILEEKDLLLTNYNMMQLSSPNIPVQSLAVIRAAINEMDMSFNKTDVVTMMIKDGFGAGNWDFLYTLMKRYSVED
jgi:5'-3' exonuclease